MLFDFRSSKVWEKNDHISLNLTNFINTGKEIRLLIKAKTFIIGKISIGKLMKKNMEYEVILVNFSTTYQYCAHICSHASPTLN